MKKVLIITSRSEKTVAWREREQYVRDFAEQVEARLDGVQLRYTTYRDLIFSVRGGKASIIDVLSGWDLKDIALVHFKNWQYETGEAPVVAAYLQRSGVAFYNSEVNVGIAPGKLAQMFRLAENGVPVPDTYYTSKAGLREIFEKNALPEGFEYPLVLKANDGSRGDDNHLIREAKEALDVLSASDIEKEYVLQNFVPNDGDYRFLFIGLDEAPLVFHRTAAEGSHLNNTSKGGSGRFIDVRELPAEYISHARKAAELLGREIGGVDILVNKENGRAFVLEVNGTPALATGFGVETKAARFAEFLKQELEGREEE